MTRRLIMDTHFQACEVQYAPCDRCGNCPAIRFQVTAPPDVRYVSVCAACIQEALAPLDILVGIPPEDS